MTSINNRANQLQQWNRRLQTMRYIYSQLINNYSITKAKQVMLTDYADKIGADFIQLIEYFLENQRKLTVKLSECVAKQWNFERLNLVDQAILFCAYSEWLVLKTDKSIIIDQAIITAKKYSDADNYKYINAILDKVIK